MAPSRHIAHLSLPLFGHVYPTLNFAGELVRRGHRVTYGTSRAFAAQVERIGARLLAYPEAMAEQAAFTGVEVVTTVAATTMEMRFYEQSLLLVEDLAEQFAGDTPDLICTDPIMFGAATVLGRRWGVPVVVTHLHFAFCTGYDWRPDRLRRSFAGQDLTELVDLATRLDVLNDKYEVPADQPAATEELVLSFLPPRFQPHRELFGPNHQFVGPALEGQSYVGQWSPPGDDRPLLLISLGSMVRERPEFTQLCVDAFAELDWHVVLTTGGTEPNRSFPPNFEVHQWVPLRSVLEHASVCLNNAGMGAVMSSVYHHTPLVLVPGLIDHEAVADRAVAMGVARCLGERDLTPELLRRAVLQVEADEAVHAAVRAMRAEIVEAGGAGRAADLVEQRLAPAHPPRFP
ncbi:macrolide family glycosyltransferase [Kutzneria albida]|uniref:Erythromycin biosynthesis protein CIII-like C-terminal domain-containing protein n=1 Tax=Kutzneria albida DSM 43870 TaxID=1449976 RepID=W5WMM4_9PSEU|nr:macrolide family glycosyltransferase [Kutzneria albida]AHH99429.1 hypothetical protein KALB_6069 [Kutzneria albida DSM 43870]